MTRQDTLASIVLQDGGGLFDGDLPGWLQDPVSSFVTDFIQAQRAPLEHLG